MILLSNPKIFREVLKLLHKLQFNFNMRHLMALDNPDLIQTYLSSLYNFTIQSFQSNISPKKTIYRELLLSINEDWQHILHQAHQLKIAGAARIEEMVQSIIVTQINEGLHIQGDILAIQRELRGEATEDSEEVEEEYKKNEQVKDEDQMLGLNRLIVNSRIESSLSFMLDKFEYIGQTYQGFIENLIKN